MSSRARKRRSFLSAGGQRVDQRHETGVEHRVHRDPLQARGRGQRSGPAPHPLVQVEVVCGAEPVVGRGVGERVPYGRVGERAAAPRRTSGKNASAGAASFAKIRQSASRAIRPGVMAATTRAAEVVEAACHLAAQTAEAYVVVLEAFGVVHRGCRQRVCASVQPAGGGEAQGEGLFSGQVGQARERDQLVPHPVPGRQLARDHGVGVAGRLQRHGGHLRAAGRWDRGQEDAGVDPSGELQHQIGVVVQDAGHDVAQQGGRLGHRVGAARRGNAFRVGLVDEPAVAQRDPTTYRRDAREHRGVAGVPAGGGEHAEPWPVHARRLQQVQRAGRGRQSRPAISRTHVERPEAERVVRRAEGVVAGDQGRHGGRAARVPRRRGRGPGARRARGPRRRCDRRERAVRRRRRPGPVPRSRARWGPGRTERPSSPAQEARSGPRLPGRAAQRQQPVLGVRADVGDHRTTSAPVSSQMLPRNSLPGSVVVKDAITP